MLFRHRWDPRPVVEDRAARCAPRPVWDRIIALFDSAQAGPGSEPAREVPARPVLPFFARRRFPEEVRK